MIAMVTTAIEIVTKIALTLRTVVLILAKPWARVVQARDNRSRAISGRAWRRMECVEWMGVMTPPG